MRPKSHAFARSWIALSVAVLTVLPAGAAAAATPTPARNSFPHVVGGYVAGKTRVAAKVRTYGGAYASAVVPDSVDLREYAPPVGDQGQIGSCVAWSIAHGLMGYYANRTGGSGDPYAPLFLYMRNVVPGGAPNAGLYPDAVLANAQSAGVDTQEDYWQGTTNYQSAPTTAQIANATNYKVTGWSRLFNGANQGANAQTVIEQAIASGSPVAIGFDVFSDFMNLRTHTVYNTVTGSSLGGHMVAAFGYDSQGLIIRNSWGTWWGNNGEAKLSWAFVNKVVSGAYTINGIRTPSAPVAMAPTVAGLSVSAATAGTAVTIIGAGLAGATQVRFGADEADFSPITEGGVTKLVATAPAHAAGTVDVTVTNATGTSAVSDASKFTYVPQAPSILALTPNAASIAGGTTITVSGTDLSDVKTVKVGKASVPAKEVTASSLTFVAPARAAGTVDVTVSTAAGTSQVYESAKLTYVTPPAPVIQSLEPSGGLTTAATPVVVTGTDFSGVTKVTAGGAAVPFTKVSGTSLKLTLPVHAAGVVNVRITGPGGTSAENADSAFTYRTPPAPVVTEITPASGPTNVKTAVVITGDNLGNASKVTVDDAKVAFTKVSGTSLKLTLATHAAGEVAIQVTTPAGVSAAGSDARFTYLAPPIPQISELAPSSGSTLVANTVMINGTDFAGTTKVTYDGTSLKYTKVSDTQLKVTIPKGVAGGELEIVVTTPGGASPSAAYTAEAPPAPEITELSVSTGLTYLATPVTLTGTGFDGATKVTIGGTSTPFKKLSATQLSITAPKHAAGPVPVVVIGPGGSSEPATFSYVAPAVPTISELASDTGYTDQVSKVSLTGADLTGTSKVTANGLPVGVVKVSDTQLTLTMPKHAAGAVEVTVTTPGGTSSAAVFTYLAPPAPEVNTVNPQFGTAGKSAVVIVDGGNFTGTTKVTLGGKPVAFKVVSDSELKVTVPARPAGTLDLLITGRGGSNSAGQAAQFSFA
jgi:hypothetical protein